MQLGLYRKRYFNFKPYIGNVVNMVHRSIEVKSMKLKASRPFSRIKKEIIKNFGQVFELRYQRGYVIVKGDLHDYRTREKLYKIITSKSVGG